MTLVQKEPKKIYIRSTAVKKVYLWNTQVRPSSKIPTSWLIAYYPMNSDRNDHKADLWVTGTTYNCNMLNTFSNSFVSWKVWNCLYKESTGWVLNTWIAPSNVFSIMFWLVMSWDNWWSVYWWTKTTDNGNGRTFQFDHYRPCVKVKASLYYADNNIEANKWYHIAFTQNSSSASFYVNWVWKNFTVDSNAWVANIQIAWSYNNAWPTCKIDEVCIYNRALTDQEVLDYYNSTL